MHNYSTNLFSHKKKNEFFKSVSISDIHFGKTIPENEYNILYEQFIK